ncbi:glycosyltransferase family 2 protein [Streptomyces olivoreticuli]
MYKISVVIATFNPGNGLDTALQSLGRQSMPSGEFEIVIVDSGSTDGTRERLAQWAPEQPNTRVVELEHSGGLAVSRNAGIESARGEFIQFLDTDDWLGNEALERMYRYGVKHQADVVVGKMVGIKGAVPRVLFKKSHPHANLTEHLLIDSLSCHAMFRREFLGQHQIRFPEGRTQVVDQTFTIRSYLMAANVSVYSDYPCYYYAGGGARGFDSVEPSEYFEEIREAVETVTRHTEPGPLRDKLHRRWLRAEMVERMRGNKLLRQPPSRRSELTALMREMIVSGFSQGVIAGLQPIQQLVTAMIVGDLQDDLRELARWESGVWLVCGIDRVHWEDGATIVHFHAELLDSGAPMVFQHLAGQDMLMPPMSESARVLLARMDATLAVNMARAGLEVTLKEASKGAEFTVPVTVERQRISLSAPTPGTYEERFRLRLNATATIAHNLTAGEKSVARGGWEPKIRVRLGGWNIASRLSTSGAS